MLRDEGRIWQCGTHQVSLARPRIVGILNVTPDSFSDGGTHLDPAAAIAHGIDLLDQGADISDVGGESTRPGFEPVDVEEELRRVSPVVEALARRGAIVSIDTRHPQVAQRALELGACIINDVTGFTDPEMVRVAAESDCGVIIMHSLPAVKEQPRREVRLSSVPASGRAVTGEAAALLPEGAALPSGSQGAPARKAWLPRDPQTADEPKPEPSVPATAAKPDALRATMAAATVHGVRTRPGRIGQSRRYALPDSTAIMREVMGFLGDQARMLMRSGVSQRRICVDPGAGFGKSAGEDVVIQRATAKMVTMGYPLMCGVSRKRFVGAVSGAAAALDRDPASFGVLMAAIEGGARLLRVHNVRQAAEAVNSYWACSHKDERRAFVAMGSNVDDPFDYLLRARDLVDRIPLTCVVNSSHVYESEPALGLTESVLNAVIELRTELAPLVLLDHLLQVEDELGRVRPADGSHGPRTIDLDLIWYDGETHQGTKLRLPHPGIGERDFVIVPLDDLVHDGERFLRYAGIEVAEPEDRIGRVTVDLGPLQ